MNHSKHFYFNKKYIDLKLIKNNILEIKNKSSHFYKPFLLTVWLLTSHRLMNNTTTRKLYSNLYRKEMGNQITLLKEKA